MEAHEYRTQLTWQGSTAGGYRSYSRDHSLNAAPAEATLELSSDPAFRGQPQRLNPEQLFLASLSSCQLLSFLALAARSGLDVVSYRDSALASMPMPEAWIARVSLRPEIVVRAPAEPSAVQRLVAQAHEECFISRSVKTAVDVDAQVTIEPSA